LLDRADPDRNNAYAEINVMTRVDTMKGRGLNRRRRERIEGILESEASGVTLDNDDTKSPE
jgi:hypothetical protein